VGPQKAKIGANLNGAKPALEAGRRCSKLLDERRELCHETVARERNTSETREIELDWGQKERAGKTSERVMAAG